MYKIFIFCTVSTCILLLLLNQTSLYNLADQLYPLASKILDLENCLIKSDKYQKLVNKYKENYSNLKQVDYLFLGDSHVQYFNVKAYFPSSSIINYGIAGDTSKGVLQRLPHAQERTKIKNGVLFMVGYNDLKYKETQTIINDQRKLIVATSKQLNIPFSKIILQSLFPVSKERSYVNRRIIQINQAAKSLCVELGCTFLDLYSHFISHKGELLNQYTRDGVHLNNKGYSMWASLLKKSLLL